MLKRTCSKTTDIYGKFEEINCSSSPSIPNYNKSAM